MFFRLQYGLPFQLAILHFVWNSIKLTLCMEGIHFEYIYIYIMHFTLRIIIIMFIFKCYFSGELIALSFFFKQQQQRCEHRIWKKQTD